MYSLRISICNAQISVSVFTFNSNLKYIKRHSVGAASTKPIILRKSLLFAIERECKNTEFVAVEPEGKSSPIRQSRNPPFQQVHSISLRFDSCVRLADKKLVHFRSPSSRVIHRT